MGPNIKYYTVSIVAIFTALGIGIFIGFSMDTKEFITEQQEGLIDLLETQFETIMNENEELDIENKELHSAYQNKSEYVENSYNHMVPEKLEGLRVAIIESNSDYVSSGIGRDIESAGGKVVNVTTLNEKILSDKNYKNKLKEVMNIITSGNRIEEIDEFVNAGYISIMGSFNEDIDQLIICGGASSEESIRVKEVDKMIIDIAKNKELPVLGVEKASVNMSYIEKYKEYKIGTVDNVDTVMGRIAMILSMGDETGNYGIKGTADSVLPIKN